MSKTTGAKYFTRMIRGDGITHVFYVLQIAARVCRFGNFNFAEIAKAIGCEDIRVKDPGEIKAKLTRAFVMNKAVVIEVVSDLRTFAKTAWVPA